MVTLVIMPTTFSRLARQPADAVALALQTLARTSTHPILPSLSDSR